MSQISRILRDTTGGGLMFWCPGCVSAHRITHGEGDGPRWTWNGDVDRPVFSPSVLVRGIRDGMSESDWEEYDKLYAAGGTEAVLSSRFATRCHTFVGCNGAQPGQIIFLGDCTHPLAGQTMDLPNWPGVE